MLMGVGRTHERSWKGHWKIIEVIAVLFRELNDNRVYWLRGMGELIYHHRLI